MRIVESGMTFEPEDSKCFHIEKSNFYNRLRDGVKTAEFLVFYDAEDDICQIIEAKSSSPNPNNKEGDNEAKFDKFIGEINDKFINSFNLYIANRLERHGKENHDEMPEVYRNTDLSSLGFKFVLIIKDHKTKWLHQISDPVKLKLKPFVKAWNIQDKNIKVLNDEIAKEKGYIE